MEYIKIETIDKDQLEKLREQTQTFLKLEHDITDGWLDLEYRLEKRIRILTEALKGAGRGDLDPPSPEDLEQLYWFALDIKDDLLPFLDLYSKKLKLLSTWAGTEWVVNEIEYLDVAEEEGYYSGETLSELANRFQKFKKGA